MEQQGSWLSVTPWKQDASRMRSTLRSDAEKAKSQKKTSLKKGGSRLLVGRVSSCPFREDTLLTKPFWLMRNFVQDTSCHLLAQHKTRPCSDKEKASNTASLVPSRLHHSSWRPKRDALGEQWASRACIHFKNNQTDEKVQQRLSFSLNTHSSSEKELIPMNKQVSTYQLVD